jgi:hypothetical protein
MAAGALALIGLISAPARIEAQEIPQIWQSQWEAHHQRYNNWRPQSHNKDYGAYGHRWVPGPDGYYYGNPNVVGGYVPHTWSYSYPTYPFSSGYTYPSYGGYAYPSYGSWYYYTAP